MLTAEELRELRRDAHRCMRAASVDSLLRGATIAPRCAASGMEFEEVRGYVPGDDVRHIDWNVTARTGEPFIKVFREERQLTVQLVVDVSGSTRVGSGGRDGRTDRRLQIARIAGGIALAGIRNRDRVGLITFTDRVERYLSPRATRGHTWAVIQHAFRGQAEGRGTNIAEALRFAARVQRRRAVFVVISDFLDAGPWGRAIATLSRRHRVHAICVHDELSAAVKKLGLVRIVDPETGRTRLVDGRGWAGEVSVQSRLGELRSSGAHAVAVDTRADPYRMLHQYFVQEGARR